MAKVYPLMYVLENSIRAVVKRVMDKKYGPAWWDEQLLTGKAKQVRDEADSRRQREDTKNSWHQRRGDHPLNYIDLGDLRRLIDARQADFVPDVIDDLDWFRQFMRELEPSRNVLCHMNPLSKLNVQDVRTRLARWNQLVARKRKQIP